MKISIAIPALFTIGLLFACTSPARKSAGATLFIAGAVVTPGRYENIGPDKQNLHDLILMAGGLHYPSPGSRGRVTVFHKNNYENGTVIILDPVKLMKEGVASDLNITLSDGDLVKVLEQYD